PINHAEIRYHKRQTGLPIIQYNRPGKGIIMNISNRHIMHIAIDGGSYFRGNITHGSSGFKYLFWAFWSLLRQDIAAVHQYHGTNHPCCSDSVSFEFFQITCNMPDHLYGFEVFGLAITSEDIHGRQLP